MSKDKQKYAGKIKETVEIEVVCTCGETIQYKEERFVSWSTIKALLALFRAKDNI